MEQKAAHAEKLNAWEEKTATIREQIAAIEGPHLKKAEKDAIAKFPDDMQTIMRKPVGGANAAGAATARSWRIAR